MTKGFSDEEKAAMKERALELSRDNGEKAVLASIDKMPEPDRTLARRVHAIIKETAPTLTPKTWYGMPAYADHDGKVVCFFQNASKFKYKYSTLGFQEAGHLDDGNFWPVAFAIMKLTAAEEARIAALVKKAVG